MSELPFERALVERTRRGDVHAFGELVRRYQQSVFNVCYRMFGQRQDAEDMTQEAFIRAFQRLETFDLERPFGPWIRRVAANLCLNQLKRRRESRLQLDDEFDRPANDGIGPEAKQELRETAAQVRAAILELPTHYRAVVELRHFQEMNYREIAQELKLPLNTVRSQLFRARKMLAKRLKIDV